METSTISSKTLYGNDIQHILTHYHNGMELIHVTNGSLNCLINGKTYSISKGTLCIINKDVMHRIYCETNNDCTLKSIMIDQNIFTADKTIFEKYIDPILNDENFSHLISSANKALVKDILTFMNEIETLESSKIEAYELSVIAYIHMIFQKLYMLYQNKKEAIENALDTDILLYRKMANYIYQNYENKISLQDIADIANISKSKCCILFKHYAQHSPIDFLNLYRLEESTYLLKNSEESILSISLSCGFGQQSYFNRLFIREYNMTPNEYRKQYKELS